MGNVCHRSGTLADIPALGEKLVGTGSGSVHL